MHGQWRQAPQQDYVAVLGQRVAELEASQRLRAYGMFYAPMLLTSFIFLFTPFYQSTVSEDGLVTSTFYTLWEMVGRGIPIGLIAVVFMAILAALLGIGTFRPDTRGVPTGIAIFSAILFLLLAFKVDAGEGAEWSTAGYAGMWLGLCGLALGIVHETHLAVNSRVRG